MPILFAIFLVCTATDKNEENISMREFVPDQILGWRAEGKIETYDRETIFDYIDGAGEIYLMYDFRKLVVCRLIKSGEPSIVVELFDMGSSQDAFGVFSHSREGEEQGIGQGSEYRGGLLCFWKDRFFVCISSERETPATKEAVPHLAREIARRIKRTGEKPKLLDLLPQEDLLAGSVRYFHLYTSLNYHYFVASENILRLSRKTEAVLARYKPGRMHLLCIRYPSEDEAKEALESFLNAYMPEAKESRIARIEENKWVGVELEGAFLVVVFDAPAETYVRTLLKAIENRILESLSKR